MRHDTMIYAYAPAYAANFKAMVHRHKDALPPPYCDMIGVDGYDALMAYLDVFGSSTIHVPAVRTIFTPCIKADILERFDGFNERALAREYGYHSATIRKWSNS